MSTDDFLVGLAYDANRGKLNDPWPITLFVSGVLVSGLVIGIDEYFKIAFGADPIVPDETEVPAAPRFIHLKDAKVFRGGEGGMISAAGGAGVPWRGKLSSVDAFLLGRLDKSQPAEVIRFPGPRPLP